MKMHRAYWIEGDTLKKKVKRSKHFFRAASAWGVDRNTLMEAIVRGVKRVELYDEEKGDTYSASIDDFLQWGWVLDLGYGSQVFLRETRWRKNGHERVQNETSEQQECLFGV
jgi:hypothetical protein